MRDDSDTQFAATVLGPERDTWPDHFALDAVRPPEISRSSRLQDGRHHLYPHGASPVQTSLALSLDNAIGCRFL